MNNLEKKFMKYLAKQMVKGNHNAEKQAKALAKIAYKASDERVKHLKLMYDDMGELCRESKKENTDLKKKLELLDVRTK